MVSPSVNTGEVEVFTYFFFIKYYFNWFIKIVIKIIIISKISNIIK